MKYYVIENNYRISMSTLQRFANAAKKSNKYVKIDKENRTIIVGNSADNFDIFYFKSRSEMNEETIENSDINGIIIYGNSFEVVLKKLTESIENENK